MKKKIDSIVISHDPSTYNYIEVKYDKAKKYFAKADKKFLVVCLNSLKADIEFFDKYKKKENRNLLEVTYGTLGNYQEFEKKVREGVKFLKNILKTKRDKS